MKHCKSKSLLTVGMKILLGVALTSTVCIGGLIYAFRQANAKVESNVNEVLSIREQDSRHLRETIVSLQDKMLSFNSYLKVNPENQIRDWLNDNFNLVEAIKLVGRDSWQDFFDRNQRRDLTRHKTVITGAKDTFTVSFGLMQENGDFTGNIENRVYALPQGVSPVAVKTQINKIAEQTSDDGALKVNLDQLATVIADEVLKAEQTRTEILQFAETIGKKEKDLLQTKRQNKKFILGISGIVCLVNLLVIFLLTRNIVERPLRSLIIAINDLRSGKFPEIPWQKRNDQIGVLAGVVNNFKDALVKIKLESRRKQKEKRDINETLDFMSATINDLEKKARNLNTMSGEMEVLAGATNSKSAFVAKQAENTALMTQKVADSTEKLRKSVRGIQAEVQRQNLVVVDLDVHTRKSRVIIDDLNCAASDINTIITIVRDISEQTKLLALNATIEAARAGEYGEGFAVVAREVKELSYETERATGNINEKIVTIDKVCQEMVLIIH
ncbi:methyl-accepting chemotaxis protein, partial [Rhodopseudomonas palustris]|nr:methyl-accepting chemotaxis protein [Rhodopseudomonas palustris]